MIVLRFRVQSQPAKTAALRAALMDVVALSREVEGVVSFDIAEDVLDANTFVATEVFEDAPARERQEALPEVARVMALLPECVAAPPEATIFHVSSSEPAM